MPDASRPDGPIGPSRFGVDRFTVVDVLDRRAEQFGDRVMMSIAGTAVTFAQMRDRSCAAANALTDMGIGAGDTVVLFTATCPEWVYIWLGAARIGAVTAAVNAANKGEFLSHALRLSRAKLVVVDAERRTHLRDIIDQVPTVKTVHTVEDSLSRLLTAASTGPPRVVPSEPDDLAALFFTSGTTGPSKAVATTWNYLFSAAAGVATAWELTAGDVVWSAMPLFHLSAAPSVLAPMLVGATTVLSATFSPGSVWDNVRACDATGFAGAGAMVSMLCNLPPDPGDQRLPLKFISAAPIPADMYRRIEQRYGVKIVTMYGMTEAFPIAFKAVSEDGVPGTSGPVNAAFDVRIVDGTGRSLPAGDVGEIVCRPRAPHVMSEGYVDAVAAGSTLSVHPHEEWFRTGDLGSLDTEGNLTYVDRVKDSLRRRGENVSSVEVETTVMSHPAVLEAAAVAVPSDLGEDDILVVVTLRTDADFDYVELLDFCSTRMPYFCVPRYLEVLDELPKNVIGRVRKDLLRRRGLSPHAWDREANGYILTR
ncbi:ATP-dependent acyl-CoA ligase [Mycobacterium sp. 1274761.0]|nr:ATP-dependent acyl-CoA ligase [Mycobacterium sp. 1274761.0]